MSSKIRQNFSPEVEAAVNRHVNMELYASYVYGSVAYYFDRDDVALKNFHEFFKQLSHEKRDHAEKFMAYQNKRGGRLVLHDIKKPERDEWGSGLEALEFVLQLEKRMTEDLLDIHALAENNKDPQLGCFIKSHYLNKQVEAIKQLGDHITNLQRVGASQSGLGEYLFDKMTLGS